MKRKSTLTKQKTKPITPQDTLKAASMFDLYDALLTERYEDCPQLIVRAKSYGIKQSEVRKLILEHVKGVKAALDYGVEIPKKGRRRF